MQKKLTPPQLKKHYQKHLAKMTHSFLKQAVGKDREQIKRLYASFCDEWSDVVDTINKRYEGFVLAHHSFRNIFERDGYRNIITKPIPIEEKKELIRIIYIIEGKTEKQRERRELKYKFIWILVLIKMNIKKLFTFKGKQKEFQHN
jgi:hypothetical protein